MSRAIALLLSVMIGASALGQGVEPPARFSVLVFSKTAGFRHGSIPAGIAAIERLGAVNGFRVEATEDAARFNDAELAAFDVVAFLSTTGDVLNPAQEDAFERFIRGGGGYVGIHAASDTEYDWPWYGNLVGAYFAGHPAVQDATILVTDRHHPSSASLPERWQRRDEWYDYQRNPRGRVHVIATLDESSYQGGGMGDDHPIAWCREFDGGRSWYTGGGHTNETFDEPAFLAHLLGGIEWAAGVAHAEVGATIDGYFEKIVLDDFVTDPMELDVAEDGRVFFVERGGSVKVWKPETQSTLMAGFIDVYSDLEDGLLGIALDPKFADNGWLYVYYSPPGEKPVNVVSRFTIVGDLIDPTSESILLEVATQRDECCHSGGSLTFDAAGNLYISTGDNTSPFASSGYAPIDERPGRAPYDAQKSASNANDLRGKILRIRPTQDGGYTIPAGNLFPVDGLDGRREIYAMGCRNPFRISIDQKYGTLYWGEVGPDAGAADPDRGPAGHDEFNRTRTAGNFGWPYAIADNKPYRDYDFAAGTSGSVFDPSSPVNESPNNTGEKKLPPARPAWMWYPYGASAEFPEFGAGGRCAMAGPVYHYDAANASPHKLPRYYDDTVFLYEWARDWIMAVKLDRDGDVLSIDPFVPGMELTRPMDLELGPDGCLYLIEWGTGFGGGNPDSLVSRIEHYPAGERPPKARAAADRTSGPVPLAVAFSSAGSHARGAAGDVAFAWDFDGDGRVDSRDPAPRHVFRAPGSYQTRLVVTDERGNDGVALVNISAGNTAPSISLDWPPDGGFVAFGEPVRYRVSVDDPEDAVYDADRLLVQPYLGHDTHAHPLHRLHDFDGVFETLRDDGHGADADVFTVLAATYRDLGGRGADADQPLAPLTARAEVVLQPKRKQAEHASSSDGIRIEKTDDPAGGGQAVVFDADGAYVSFRPVNLHAISAASLRIASAGARGTLELRAGAVDGPLVGRAAIEPAGGLVLAPGDHELRIEYFERTGGAGLHLRVADGAGPKRTIDPALLRHGPDRAPGLAVAYYELPPRDALPDFGALEPYRRETVPTIDFPSTSGAFLGSGRSDNVGAVFTGFLAITEDTFCAFFLESDDGARLLVDGRLIVDNDGLHGMVERSQPLAWRETRLDLDDPGGTHELFVVYRTSDTSPLEVKLNWIDFRGVGVAADRSAPSARPAAHDHGHGPATR